jgi:heptosyltransferase-1
MRILVIRLSALGDIVHALPALTDLRGAFPQATIDFAVDERFVDLARLHGGIDRVLAIPLKRWKRKLTSAGTWRELARTVQLLRAQPYDLVLDLHGLNKSALVALTARSTLRIGPHPRFCGEWMGPRIYHRFCNTEGSIMPVPRMRAFVADAIGQISPAKPSYGLAPAWSGGSSRQVLLIHSTSAADKLWPEPHWIALGQKLIDGGWEPILPWGDAAERERSERLVAAMGSPADVAPRKTLSEWAVFFSQTRMVVGVDTGLTHLAAAYGVPSVAIFSATSSGLFAPQDPEQSRAVGDLNQSPALEKVAEAARDLLSRTATAPAGK